MHSPRRRCRCPRCYLECGILAHGFARARCAQCGHDFLIAFSCKGRGVCPSCNTRRMTETAAHLVDHVLPPLPVRQWVLAVPKRLRYFLKRDAALQGATLRLFLRAVEQCPRGHSAGAGATARLGAVAFIHRFGTALNAHLHFHCVVIDGVFAPTATGGVVFHPATTLDGPAIATVQAKVRRRLLQSLVRRGLLAEDDAQAMAPWDHGGGFSVDASVRIDALTRLRPSLPDAPRRTRPTVRLIELHGARRCIDRLASNPFVLGDHLGAEQEHECCDLDAEQRGDGSGQRAINGLDLRERAVVPHQHVARQLPQQSGGDAADQCMA